MEIRILSTNLKRQSLLVILQLLKYSNVYVSKFHFNCVLVQIWFISVTFTEIANFKTPRVFLYYTKVAVSLNHPYTTSHPHSLAFSKQWLLEETGKYICTLFKIQFIFFLHLIYKSLLLEFARTKKITIQMMYICYFVSILSFNLLLCTTWVQAVCLFPLGCCLYGITMPTQLSSKQQYAFPALLHVFFKTMLALDNTFK